MSNTQNWKMSTKNNVPGVLRKIRISLFPHGGVNNGFFLTQAQSNKRAVFSLGRIQPVFSRPVGFQTFIHPPRGVYQKCSYITAETLTKPKGKLSTKITHKIQIQYIN